MGKSSKPKSVLMVCVDNISRSPIAEAVLHDAICKLGLQNEWRVDSAAIEGWNLGAKPDPRALSVLRHHNIEYYSCARRLVLDDFDKFDYILGMDQSNMASLKLLMPHYSNATLLLLSDFLFGFEPNHRAIEDPYYAPFEKIFEQCSYACSSFLKQARRNQIVI
ncbi:low molecular weight phosphotyrosine protein phosphatase 2-like isoform X2 [Drosophila innubila]|uniref:low molecular weight phosphotyrosine protein phosphatase 2-like isoform X2 n=1 Tax=Drosophila innubila TaxID=198719 RepID=UPI00148C19FF|nr:low molecular weight phosphotyrosine protein phosphatase 2-like isoform X2 [Drosophila innubila]